MARCLLLTILLACVVLTCWTQAAVIIENIVKHKDLTDGLNGAGAVEQIWLPDTQVSCNAVALELSSDGERLVDDTLRPSITDDDTCVPNVDANLSIRGVPGGAAAHELSWLGRHQTARNAIGTGILGSSMVYGWTSYRKMTHQDPVPDFFKAKSTKDGSILKRSEKKTKEQSMVRRSPKGSGKIPAALFGAAMGGFAIHMVENGIPRQFKETFAPTTNQRRDLILIDVADSNLQERSPERAKGVAIPIYATLAATIGYGLNKMSRGKPASPAPGAPPAKRSMTTFSVPGPLDFVRRDRRKYGNDCDTPKDCQSILRRLMGRCHRSCRQAIAASNIQKGRWSKEYNEAYHRATKEHIRPPPPHKSRHRNSSASTRLGGGRSCHTLLCATLVAVLILLFGSSVNAAPSGLRVDHSDRQLATRSLSNELFELAGSSTITLQRRDDWKKVQDYSAQPWVSSDKSVVKVRWASGRATMFTKQGSSATTNPDWKKLDGSTAKVTISPDKSQVEVDWRSDSTQDAVYDRQGNNSDSSTPSTKSYSSGSSRLGGGQGYGKIPLLTFATMLLLLLGLGASAAPLTSAETLQRRDDWKEVQDYFAQPWLSSDESVAKIQWKSGNMTVYTKQGSTPTTNPDWKMVDGKTAEVTISGDKSQLKFDWSSDTRPDDLFVKQGASSSTKSYSSGSARLSNGRGCGKVLLLALATMLFLLLGPGVSGAPIGTSAVPSSVSNVSVLKRETPSLVRQLDNGLQRRNGWTDADKFDADASISPDKTQVRIESEYGAQTVYVKEGTTVKAVAQHWNEAKDDLATVFLSSDKSQVKVDWNLGTVKSTIYNKSTLDAQSNSSASTRIGGVRSRGKLILLALATMFVLLLGSGVTAAPIGTPGLSSSVSVVSTLKREIPIMSGQLDAGLRRRNGWTDADKFDADASISPDKTQVRIESEYGAQTVYVKEGTTVKAVAQHWNEAKDDLATVFLSSDKSQVKVDWNLGTVTSTIYNKSNFGAQSNSSASTRLGRGQSHQKLFVVMLLVVILSLVLPASASVAPLDEDVLRVGNAVTRRAVQIVDSVPSPALQPRTAWSRPQDHYATSMVSPDRTQLRINWHSGSSSTYVRQSGGAAGMPSNPSDWQDLNSLNAYDLLSPDKSQVIVHWRSGSTTTYIKQMTGGGGPAPPPMQTNNDFTSSSSSSNNNNNNNNGGPPQGQSQTQGPIAAPMQAPPSSINGSSSVRFNNKQGALTLLSTLALLFFFLGMPASASLSDDASLSNGSVQARSVNNRRAVPAAVTDDASALQRRTTWSRPQDHYARSLVSPDRSQLRINWHSGSSTTYNRQNGGAGSPSNSGGWRDLNSLSAYDLISPDKSQVIVHWRSGSTTTYIKQTNGGPSPPLQTNNDFTSSNSQGPPSGINGSGSVLSQGRQSLFALLPMLSMMLLLVGTPASASLPGAEKRDGETLLVARSPIGETSLTPASSSVWAASGGSHFSNELASASLPTQPLHSENRPQLEYLDKYKPSQTSVDPEVSKAFAANAHRNLDKIDAGKSIPRPSTRSRKASSVQKRSLINAADDNSLVARSPGGGTGLTSSSDAAKQTSRFSDSLSSASLPTEPLHRSSHPQLAYLDKYKPTQTRVDPEVSKAFAANAHRDLDKVVAGKSIPRPTVRSRKASAGKKRSLIEHASHLARRALQPNAQRSKLSVLVRRGLWTQPVDNFAVVNVSPRKDQVDITWRSGKVTSIKKPTAESIRVRQRQLADLNRFIGTQSGWNVDYRRALGAFTAGPRLTNGATGTRPRLTGNSAILLAAAACLAMFVLSACPLAAATSSSNTAEVHKRAVTTNHVAHTYPVPRAVGGGHGMSAKAVGGTVLGLGLTGLMVANMASAVQTRDVSSPDESATTSARDREAAAHRAAWLAATPIEPPRAPVMGGKRRHERWNVLSNSGAAQMPTPLVVATVTSQENQTTTTSSLAASACTVRSIFDKTTEACDAAPSAIPLVAVVMLIAATAGALCMVSKLVASYRRRRSAPIALDKTIEELEEEEHLRASSKMTFTSMLLCLALCVGTYLLYAARPVHEVAQAQGAVASSSHHLPLSARGVSSKQLVENSIVTGTTLALAGTGALGMTMAMSPGRSRREGDSENMRKRQVVGGPGEHRFLAKRAGNKFHPLIAGAAAAVSGGLMWHGLNKDAQAKKNGYGEQKIADKIWRRALVVDEQ